MYLYEISFVVPAGHLDDVYRQIDLPFELRDRVMQHLNYVFSSEGASWSAYNYSTTDDNVNIYIDNYECYSAALNFKNTADYALVNVGKDDPDFDPDDHILVPIGHTSIRVDGHHVRLFDDLDRAGCPGVEVLNLHAGLVKRAEHRTYRDDIDNYYRVDKTIIDLIRLYQIPENVGLRDIPLVQFIVDSLS